MRIQILKGRCREEMAPEHFRQDVRLCSAAAAVESAISVLKLKAQSALAPARC